MAMSRPLLARLLKTPDLAKVVPHLAPDVVHRVIQMCGLEDSSEFVAMASPAQLSRILDADVWQTRTPGADEQFDVDRFGVWLDVLMQSGAAVAAEKLIGLDRELVVAGFSRHVAVFDHASVSSYTTLDGDRVPSRVSDRAPTAEIGRYVVEARRTSAWETIIDLLSFLQGTHPEYFQGLMRSCVRLSNSPREADGFYTLLQDAEQDLFDLAGDRDARRAQQGFVTPAQARAFMQSARHIRLVLAQPPDTPLARAYFRGFEATSGIQGDALEVSDGPAPDPPGDPSDVPAAMAEVMDVLREAGALADEPRALLPSADRGPSRLALIQEYVASHPASRQQLAYLANAIIAGCSVQARPFTPEEASQAAAATCNLGLEHWPRQWRDCDLIAAFQVGWTVLHRDVAMHAAERLIAVTAAISCSDRDIHLRLRGLRRELRHSVSHAAPWRARNALDVIVMLDAPCWAALVALIDECPVLHAAIGASHDRSRSIKPSDFEFISERTQIAVIHEFVETLTPRLTG